MFSFRKVAMAVFLAAVATSVMAQTGESPRARDAEQLKIAAMEALISAPPERALPIVTKVLRGSGSDELKERALFILSQIDRPEAQALLLETARSGSGQLRHEAIRMMGISGETAALSELYTGGDAETKEAVLEAWLIAGDEDAVYQAAANARDPDEFEAAVEILGAMGATEQLRALSSRADMSESLIEAYAVAGDIESLRELAMDAGNPGRQAQAIHGLGVTGGKEVGEILVGIYGSTDSPVVKDAVMEGLLISGDDEAVLQLFRQSRNDDEKAELLETLVMMDSEAVWDLIDATLENGQ
jgi:HEAT repeat protein